MNEHLITPIAHIRSDFKEKFGIPRQSGRAPSLKSKIIFTEKFRKDEAIKNITEFSHIWLIFGFSKCVKSDFSMTVRPPRLGGNKRVGVFASRSPFRPNSLGLSSVKLEGIEKSDEGTCLIVSGADILDGSPIYDIKPYLPFTDSHPDAIGGYADGQRDYKLQVNISKNFLDRIDQAKRDGLIECLQDDPRPSYHNDSREYGMSFHDYEIKFFVCGDELTVTNIEKTKND